MGFLLNYYIYFVYFQGSGLVGYTMFLELLPKYLRGAAGIIDGTAWACSVMLLPLLAYLLQDYSWRYLQLLMAAFSAYSLILPWSVEATQGSKLQALVYDIISRKDAGKRSFECTVAVQAIKI